ncbi:MAG: DUF483 domain-containing protein, partial [Actinobacteria bacterium]|nr:DUF483 domain-containing protein [Actinomycetota bacterium]
NREIFDWVIGNLCGIPECCIKKCTDYASKYPDGDHIIELAKDYQKQLNGSKDSISIRINGRSVHKEIGYIPCAPDCKNTKLYLKQHNEQWDIFCKLMGKNPRGKDV